MLRVCCVLCVLRSVLCVERTRNTHTCLTSPKKQKKATYRGSADERRELLEEYARHAGDMRRVFDWLILSRPELDSHRFADAIDAAIAAGEW